MAGKVRPDEIDAPALLMNFPFTVSNAIPNNVLMTDRRPYDHPRAFRQWTELYNKLAEDAVVWLLPHDNREYQDQPYVANVGAVLPHDPELFLLANYRSEPRRGEELIAKCFAKKLGYWTKRPPHHWEGEADLKWLRGNLYVGGHGIRSDIKAYDWMRDALDMIVLPLQMDDEKLYHLDCIFFAVDAETAVVATDVLAPAELRAIERHVEVHNVPSRFIYDGWTNAVRLGDKVHLNAPPTKESQDACEDLYVKLGFEPVITNLGEFDKSGADLSCLVLHLNHNGRK